MAKSLKTNPMYQKPLKLRSQQTDPQLHKNPHQNPSP